MYRNIRLQTLSDPFSRAKKIKVCIKPIFIFSKFGLPVKVIYQSQKIQESKVQTYPGYLWNDPHTFFFN